MEEKNKLWIWSIVIASIVGSMSDNNIGFGIGVITFLLLTQQND